MKSGPLLPPLVNYIASVQQYLTALSGRIKCKFGMTMPLK